MENKRQYLRRTYREPLQFMRQERGLLEGTVAYDLSEGGVRFQSLDFLPLKSELDIQLSLGDGIKAGLKGKVAWIQRVPHAEAYQVGLEFCYDEKNLTPRLRIRESLAALADFKNLKLEV